MNELIPLLPRLLMAGVAGAALGAIFFGGLWWTAQRLVTSLHPARLALVSLAGRMGILGLGLFMAAQFGADVLISTTLGILAVRQWLIQQTRLGSTGIS